MVGAGKCGTFEESRRSQSDVSTRGSAHPPPSGGSPQATFTSILQHVQDTLDVPISTRTISRRLVESGLHSRRPLRALALTPQRRRERLEWCRARAIWVTEWRKVVFSDESRFCFFNDSQRI
ncbi:transposable element Tcb1 transposase [Trichonephila clavipes]|nr:transposable element Tcb1 transposase [Trichonephila clavipes]